MSDHPAIQKTRFIEPGNLPYRRSIKNHFVYDKYIRTPSTGLLTLTTIAKTMIDDTLMYSESISKIDWKDVLTADIVFIGIFTFNAIRGYEIATYIRQNSQAIVVMGGLHASMNYHEAIEYCDYVLLSEADESILEFIRKIKGAGSLEFKGLAYKKDGQAVFTGYRDPPQVIDTIPNRNLLHKYRKMVGHNTIWLQVHASRGCPHACDYCALVRHFGRKVRTRTPANVVDDIRQTIQFHRKSLLPRLSNILWLTDDNFFADRKWAIEVLKEIIKNHIRYKFTIQARYEVGFDDEILDLLRQAGFFEIAMGIEFIDDCSFEAHNKNSSTQEILKSIKNIKMHGLNVRGLFIVGAKNHEVGIGTRLAEFVFANDISGVLIQSMYFIPGTPVYDQYRDKLLHQDWSKYTGNVVHYPELISPSNLQIEIMVAIKMIYSFKRLMQAILFKRGIARLLFIGEYFWQKSVRRSLGKELPALLEYDK